METTQWEMNRKKHLSTSFFLLRFPFHSAISSFIAYTPSKFIYVLQWIPYICIKWVAKLSYHLFEYHVAGKQFWNFFLTT